MSDFRKGNFDRDRAPRLLRHFCPVQSVDSILEIDLTDLYNSGKRLLLLDVDNTLLEWRSEEIPETTHSWIDEAQKLGFQTCILSNTRNPMRLDRLAKAMECDYMVGKFKPSREMYHAALKKYGSEADEAIMVGDQLFTDVLGANRSGIDAILVRQMAPLEFIGTRVNRIGERIIRARIHRAIVEHPEDMPVGGAAAIEMLISNPTVRQFVKFCIVGGSSFVIDAGLHFVLMFLIHWNGVLLSQTLGIWLIDSMPALFSSLGVRPDGSLDPAGAASPIFKILTAAIAIFNSFWWNRVWTFGITTKEQRASQLRKFYIVAVIGLVLNTLIVSLLSNIIPGHLRRSWLIATIIATIVVAFWNFFGQKLWTFRKKHHPVETLAAEATPAVSPESKGE